jgi:hypothetical protein
MRLIGVAAPVPRTQDAPAAVLRVIHRYRVPGSGYQQKHRLIIATYPGIPRVTGAQLRAWAVLVWPEYIDRITLAP